MERKFLLKQRPETQFDPSDFSHRMAYRDFIKKRTWGAAPRFYLEEGYSCIPEMIKDKLINYYIDDEFV